MTAFANDITRFFDAQEPVFEAVCAELRTGRKKTHWMWFVFPQLRGLGRTSTAQFYGIASAAEALAYWQHPELGPRLRACVQLVLATPPGNSAHDIFGSPDDLKLRSCLTLFQRVAPDEPEFGAALKRFYSGIPDRMTLDLLAAAKDGASE